MFIAGFTIATRNFAKDFVKITERHVIDNHVAVPNFPFEICFTTSALLIHINNRAVSCWTIQSIYDLLVHECVPVDNYMIRNSEINNFFPIYDKVFFIINLIISVLTCQS
jgi:hypothetical protein